MKGSIVNICVLVLVICGENLCNGAQAKSERNSGFFWHITDMHWDPTYMDTEVGWSCNDRTLPSYGKYGDYLCDAPWLLVESAIDAMKDIMPDPDFVIWTGDDTPHIWNDTILNKRVVLDLIFNLTDLIQDAFPNTTTFSALGNHDWSPKSQLPPNSHPMYDAIADKWSGWLLTEEAETTFRKAAYYTIQIPESNLRVVVLNTNLYYKSNAETEGIPDPANQFQWFENVLLNATSNNEKVLVLGHVPPGVFEKHRDYSWFYPEYNDKFLSIIKNYSQTITSMHFAHHHTDAFRVLYQDGDPISSLLLAPAVAPWETTLDGVMGGKGNNPAIRLVEYDLATGTALDVHQYYLNLTKANTDDNDHWELEYKATDYYLQPDMSTDSLANILNQMWQEDDMFKKYYMANGVLYDPDETWDYETKVVHCCAAGELYFHNYKACYEDRMKAIGAASLISPTSLLLLPVAVTLHIILACY